MVFKQPGMSGFDLNATDLSPADLVIRVCAGIKLSISSSLHRVSESMKVDPSRLSEYFQFAFSQETQMEALH